MHADYQSALRVTSILAAHGFEAYIVGGAVRDLWLGRVPKDFDIATSATPGQLMRLREFKKIKYKDTAQAFGVTRVFLDGQAIEVATFRKDINAHKGRKHTLVEFAELEDDVMRRDFTINALALDPEANFVIDYVGGITDLVNKRVNFIGSARLRIKEDPLRLLRAIRFKNQLGFEYGAAAAGAIRQAVKEGFAGQVATDRLRDELTSMLVHPSRRQALLDLYSFGILKLVLPEVTAGIGVEQPPEFHAEGDVWQHELLIMDYLPNNPSKQLAWAALLHDIGKGPTSVKPRGQGGRIRFDRHYAVGAEMAKTVLRRLKFSNRDVNDISWLVYHHMSIDDLPAMRPSHQQRMMGHPRFADLLELHRADAAASWRPSQPHSEKPEFTAINDIWHEYLSKTPARKQPSLKRDLGIDGNWLKRNFASELQPGSGPLMGKILADLDEWYRDEGVTDENLYRERARQMLEKQNSKALHSKT